MKDKKFFTTKTIAGLGVLTASIIILQFIANYVSFGPVSITLSLIPIVIGALMYGPLGGAFLGLINGFIVMAAPSTISFFFAYNPWATVLICLTKTTLAGLIAGLIFLPFKDKHPVIGSIIASCLVPIINTGIFAGLVVVFFYDKIASISETTDPVTYLFLSIIGINFIIEFAVNAILSPAVYQIYKRAFPRSNIN